MENVKNKSKLIIDEREKELKQILEQLNTANF